jgi:hypothetical protein
MIPPTDEWAIAPDSLVGPMCLMGLTIRRMINQQEPKTSCLFPNNNYHISELKKKSHFHQLLNKLGPCLLSFKIQKFFKILRHIESLGVCMEY